MLPRKRAQGVGQVDSAGQQQPRRRALRTAVDSEGRRQRRAHQGIGFVVEVPLETTHLVLLAREAVDDAFKRSIRSIWLHCFGLQLLVLAVLCAIAKAF